MKRDAISFESRRNSVKAHPFGDSYLVEKVFTDKLCCEKEASIYKLLEGKPVKTARLISSDGAKLTLSYLPGVTFVELLERQERQGSADLAPWSALGRWILDFNAQTGMCMRDVNLKNFLYDESTGSVAGVDFEECAKGDIKDMAAGLCAFILLYSPENTPLKRRISGHMSDWFTQNIPCDSDELAALTESNSLVLTARRQVKREEQAGPMKGVSAILLAGGCSTRMGTNKAALMFRGQTLMEYQIEKLKGLGIEDVIVSGAPAVSAGVCAVPDVYIGKGPLSGIHAGLKYARTEHCLVLGVDAPLVPTETLRALVREHIALHAQITILEHGGKIEPLIGVYEKGLADAAEEILKGDNTSIRVLLRQADCHLLPYTGDEALLFNCNTPQEYEALCNMEKYKYPKDINNT